MALWGLPTTFADRQSQREMFSIARRRFKKSRTDGGVPFNVNHSCHLTALKGSCAANLTLQGWVCHATDQKT